MRIENIIRLSDLTLCNGDQVKDPLRFSYIIWLVVVGRAIISVANATATAVVKSDKSISICLWRFSMYQLKSSGLAVLLCTTLTYSQNYTRVWAKCTSPDCYVLTTPIDTFNAATRTYLLPLPWPRSTEHKTKRAGDLQQTMILRKIKTSRPKAGWFSRVVTARTRSIEWGVQREGLHHWRRTRHSPRNGKSSTNRGCIGAECKSLGTEEYFGLMLTMALVPKFIILSLTKWWACNLPW